MTTSAQERHRRHHRHTTAACCSAGICTDGAPSPCEPFELAGELAALRARVRSAIRTDALENRAGDRGRLVRDVLAALEAPAEVAQ